MADSLLEDDALSETGHQYDKKVDELFGETGTLSTSVPGFMPRLSQTEMARAIAQTLAEQKTLIAEAGTGTGKTYAYLVPALLWGGKVIISTGTKNLQDQLCAKDIPTIRKALLIPVSIALLKGRSNYLCYYHLDRTLQNGRLTAKEDVKYLREISRFSKTSKTGDKAELNLVPETASVWNLVTSTHDTCLWEKCPHYQECFVMKARKEAQQADVVVVNHHLFFADMALKEEGMADLLPVSDTVIFDEAHQLPEVATLFFGDTIASSAIIELCRDVLTEGLSYARDGAKWPDIVAPVEKAVRDLRLTLPEESVKWALHQIPANNGFFAALEILQDNLDTMLEVLKSQAERADTIEQCRDRAEEICDGLEKWLQPHGIKQVQKEAEAVASVQQNTPKKEEDTDNTKDSADKQEYVYWLETFASSLQLHKTPLSIAPIFNKQRAGAPRSWIFTSATLAVKQDFNHYAAQMGLWHERAQTWPSPFHYQEQGLFYVPSGLPEPNTMGYTDAVIDAALPVIGAAGGKTFFLCTTLRAVNRVAERLDEEFKKRGWKFPLLIQGTLGKTELLQRFRELGNAVLVGSQSFWEGVDVKGDALSVVIIDKIPFSPPDDPVLAARVAELEKKGLSGFVHQQLPETIINLKQGAGRLIRGEKDRGVLMICDPRLISKNYGKRIWQSMPPFKRTRVLTEVEAFFKQDNVTAQETLLPHA